MATEMVLTNQTNSKQVLLRCVNVFHPRMSQIPLKYALPGQTPDNTIIFRFQGQMETANITFAIFNDGTDVANGTHTSTVTTVAEQISYIKTYIFTAGVLTTWKLYDTLGIEYVSPGVTGVIESFESDKKAGNQAIVPCTIVFTRGRAGALS